jgi:NAD(P)H-dependent FMN reductase
MRKLVVALAAGAIGVGGVVAPAAAQPTAHSCHGGVVSSSVNPSAFGPGRRAVAGMFFGDYPRAVQDAERALQELCASQ